MIYPEQFAVGIRDTKHLFIQICRFVVTKHMAQKATHEDEEDYEGIEWWCRNQCASMGAHFHYDTAISVTLV